MKTKAYICFCLSLLLMSTAGAQTYKVFKGDTINRIDKQKRQQGLWRKYYSTDTLFAEGRYKDGVRIGTHRTFYPSGKPEAVLQYTAGTGNCTVEFMYESGKQKATGHYIGKEKDGVWKYYD